MTNNNDWNTVEWDETPEDVEAVVTFESDEPSYYKVVDGILQVQCYRSDRYGDSGLSDSIGRAIEYFGDRFHLRPTPITQPTRTAESTAVATLEQLGYEWEGGEFWKPPLGKKPDFTTPSISTILQEAQQSLLKHHGVTGKVKFTVTCS